MVRVFPILFFIIYFTSFCRSQVTTFEKNGKWGYSYDGDIVKKASFDSIVVRDPKIVTAYKKNKVSYYSISGDKTFSGKMPYTSAFVQGSGILQKKSEYAIIDANGDFIMGYTRCLKPKKYGQLIVVNHSNVWFEVLSPMGVLVSMCDSVNLINNWLIAYNQVLKTETVRKLRLTGIKNVQDQVPYTAMKIFDVNLGKLIADEAFELTDFHGLNQLTFYDKSSSVYTKNDTSKVENLNDLVYYAPDYLSGHQTHDSKTRLNLYQMPDLKLVISGDFQKYEFHNGLIFGFKDTTQAENEISLYDLNGTLIRPSLQFVRLLADGRMVLKKDSLHYISDKFGQPLSQFYSFIGDETCGLRAVYNQFTYSYIDDKTYQKIGQDWPLIGRYRATYPSSSRRRNFFEVTFHEVGNLGCSLINRPPVPWDLGNTANPNDILMEAEPDGFYDGMSVVCLYNLNPTRTYSNLTMVTSDEDLRYNYIDASGNLMNKETYLACFKFYNGRAFVKMGEFYYLIDKTGKRIPSFKFDEVEENYPGYYTVKTGFKMGVIGPDFNYIIPLKPDNIRFYDGKYFDSSNMFLFEIPEN